MSTPESNYIRQSYILPLSRALNAWTGQGGVIDDYFFVNEPEIFELSNLKYYLDEGEDRPQTRTYSIVQTAYIAFALSDYYFSNYLLSAAADFDLNLFGQNPGLFRLLSNPRPFVRRQLFPPLPLVPVLPVNMATFQNCSFYHVLVLTTNYSPPETEYMVTPPAVVTAIALIKADKIAKAIIISERPRLKLEGANKTRQYEDFMKVFETIICDYDILFEDLINLRVDQHASIVKLQAAITATAPANTVARDGAAAGGGGDQVTDTNCFKFYRVMNAKLYSILVLITGGHAHEIVMRVRNADGREALFLLRADAMKQTDGQVISLQKTINDSSLMSNKHPATFLDKLQRNCQELDSLLRFQDSTNGFGNVMIKAAIVNSLPDEYKSFKVNRDSNDTRNETVDALINSVVNHFTTYIEKDGSDAKTSNATSTQSKSAKRRAATAKAKAVTNSTKTSTTNSKSKNEKAKAKALSDKSDNNSLPEKDCILCKEAGHTSNIRHWFRDCPTLDKVKNMGESSSQHARVISSNPTKSSKKGNGNTRTVTIEVPDVDSDG